MNPKCPRTDTLCSPEDYATILQNHFKKHELENYNNRYYYIKTNLYTCIVNDTDLLLLMMLICNYFIL